MTNAHDEDENMLASGPQQMTGMDEKAILEKLARAYDREEAAQRGEPDPWLDGKDDEVWVSERLACASVALSALPAAPMPGVKAIEVSIKPMRLSDDRCDYFVSFKCGDREVTPHVFRERFKAEYHVAEYRWLFGQGPKPGIMEFRQDEWPAREFTAEERRAFVTLSSLDVPAHPEGVKAGERE